MVRVIRNPEMTKKTSTPMKPPETPRCAWNSRTRPTAIVRSPSMSVRYFIFDQGDGNAAWSLTGTEHTFRSDGSGTSEHRKQITGCLDCRLTAPASRPTHRLE